MTKEKKILAVAMEALKDSYGKCPFCGGDNIDHGPDDYFYPYHYIHYRCMDCSKEYDEVYEYVGSGK